LLSDAIHAADVALTPHRDSLLQATVRIRYERRQGTSLIMGHGTAFAANLARYGYPGARYLLTAAHNVLDDDGQPHTTLKIEIQDGAARQWLACKVAACDAELDLCVVEAAQDLPRVLLLAETDPPAGSAIVMAGSPRGVPVALFDGTLTRKFERGSVRSRARIPFDHGDSGGPIACPESGKVIGVAVAGVPKDGDLDRSVGLYVPVVAVQSFLESHRKGLAASAPDLGPAPSVVSAVEPPATFVLPATPAAPGR
jgi:hypothetical protein